MRRSGPLLSQTAVSEKVGLLRGQHVYAVSDHSDHPRATPQKHGAAEGFPRTSIPDVSTWALPQLRNLWAAFAPSSYSRGP